MNQAASSRTLSHSAQIVDLKGYDTFSVYYDSINDKNPKTFFLFIGTRENGVSWSRDSVEGKF